MESRNEKKQGRFQIEKLEERIAPSHLSQPPVQLPDAAAHGAHGIAYHDAAPASELGHGYRKIIIDV